MKFFSIKNKIFFLIFIPSMLMVFFSSLFLYFDKRKVLFDNYNKLVNQTENNIIQSIRIVDKSYCMIENFLKIPLEKASVDFLSEYHNKNKIVGNMDLESIKNKYNNDIDLYIIDNGVITYATYSKVIGLDFKVYPDFYQKLQNILKNNSTVYDRLSIELTTGNLRLWAYIPSPDKKYIFELGLSSNKIKNIINDIDIVNISQNLKEYNYLLKNVKIFDRLGDEINSAEYGKKNIKDIIDTIKKNKTYEIKNKGNEIIKYIYVHLPEDILKPSDPSKIIELTYDISPIKQELTKYITQLLLIILITVFLSTIISFTLSNFITKPVINLNNAVKQFKEKKINIHADILTNDELGELSKEFNNMVDIINAHTGNLEKTVKQRTEELEITNQKLKKLDNLKNEFIANIIHDFRSPLTVILNVADLSLKMMKDNDNNLKEEFELIYKSSLKLKKSIDKLLDLSKLDIKGLKLKIKKIDIITFLNTLIDYYSSALINTKIKILNNIKISNIEDFYTDCEKLEEVINNILSNAIKFCNQDDGLIEITLKETANEIIIIISDNGIGIPCNKLNIIFDRFEQLTDKENIKNKGTGIGLAYSKQLIEYMKGELWAESNGINKGSKFFIKLKKGKNVYSEDEIIEENDVTINDRKINNDIIKIDLEKLIIKDELVKIFDDLNKEDEFDYKKAKILLIDDDIYVLKIVMQYLKIRNYKNFIITTNGRRGLNAIYEYNPDIIVCDYNMPDINGKVIHENIINNPLYKNIPFIFLSAIDDDEIVNERREKGAFAYLKKPIDEKDLFFTFEIHLKKYFEYIKTLRYLTIDELTGLNNRRAINKNLNDKIFLRSLRDLSIIFFDIDNFKEINDNYGHQMGDKVLIEISSIIKSAIRKYDISGRYGGDEFIIILPDTNINQAEKVAKSLKENINNLIINFKDIQIKITCSFGISSLLDNQKYICSNLNIKNLNMLYNIKNSKNADWNYIENQKAKIIDLMIEMTDKALYEAKKFHCNNCGYTDIVSSNTLTNCPKCLSKNIINGKNRIVSYK